MSLPEAEYHWIIKRMYFLKQLQGLLLIEFFKENISTILAFSAFSFAADKVKFEPTPTEPDGAQYCVVLVICLLGFAVALPVSFDLISLYHTRHKTKK